ncbi:MAG: hypothetical protein GOVbin630_189 [Prokaryotic dsDNA virus sp.]|nr:MAG: hypothetical protein GOVbin630_189 [Prokaryotic dsDNA virus sp.]|tara:strand:+ start:6866 stop:7219 length:354 start_codon:yes stop_codon:yes gene_type:complete
MTEKSPPKFAIYKEEYEEHMRNILFKRQLAHEYLNHFSVVRQMDEWVSFYGCLCEYIGVLYHFENALEKITLTADWDEEKQYWLMGEKSASGLMLYLTNEILCRQDLLNYNVSFSRH